jgi:hypothetical protein
MGRGTASSWPPSPRPPVTFSVSTFIAVVGCSMLFVVDVAPKGRNRCLRRCLGTEYRVEGVGTAGFTMLGDAGECVITTCCAICFGAMIASA